MKSLVNILNLDKIKHLEKPTEKHLKKMNADEGMFKGFDISQYKDKHIKVIVEEKTDTNMFGQFIDRLHNESKS